MSKQVWFLLPEQETLEDDLTTVTSFSLQSQESMSDNSPQNSQVVPRLDLNNQTNSPSDSRESTQNDISSPSMHRGFSSDDNSGWKSETTETSEGNLSLSQYPLDDPSCGEESPQENNSLHEEALTSAITEVSKDFISGNFSPGKYPPVESDSSDGDHHLDGHTGAVYARYPESATGMSDCEWNPYGTDNDNETPRSSASDSEFRNIQAFTATSSMRQKDSEIRIPTASMNNGELNRMISNPTVTRDFVRIPTDTVNEDKTRDTNVEDINRDFMRISIDKDGIPTMSSLEGRQFNRYEIPSTSDNRENAQYRPAGISKSEGQQSKTNKETSNVLPASRRLAADIVKDSYAMYSPEKEFDARSSVKTDKTSTTSSTLLGSGDRTSQLTANQYIPGSHREMYGTQSYNQLSRNTESMPKASTSEIKGNVLSGSSSTTIVPDSQDTVETLVSSSMSSVDTARRESASKYGSSSSSKPSEAPYVPVGDRAKLLGLPEDFLDQPKPSASSDFAVPRIRDLPLLSRVQIPEKDTDLPSNSKQESMSQRVSKLLEDASNLGTTLHHHLYSREALGLEGDREPTVLRSYSPLRKSDNFVQKSAETLRSPGSALLIKSGEQSVRSSLGDEVAKLMTKSNEGTVNDLTNVPSNSSYVPLKINTISSSESMNVISAQSYPSLATATVGGGPGSTDSQESADSLSQRVKKILSDTAYADRSRQSTAAPVGSVPTNFDYSRLQRDLQEIQSNLDPGIDYNMRISNPSPDFSKASDKSTESSKAHKLLWDHGADLGYDDSLSGRFFGTMKTDTETECDSTYSGKGYNGLSDTLELVNKPQKDTAEVVSDQVESDFEDRSLKVAPDVEEIIRRYQTEKPDKLMDSGDSSGLASKVMKILSQEPPRKQAISILKSAKQEEREMIKRMADKPKLETSYDSSQESTNSSFVIQDKDVRKQLEWSQMSGIDKSINNSYLSGLKTEPFSALGNAKTFLSSQLAKNADRTFNHSIDIKTPYRHVLDCYPVYGVERTRGAAEVDQFGRTEPDGVKEAWADGASSQEVPAELLFGATSSDTANVRPGSRDHQRTYSDPRELSPEARTDSAPVVTVEVATETEDGHTRSKSEEPRYGEELPRDRFYNLEPAVSATDRRAASSPHGDEREKEKLLDVRKKETITTPPSDSSPSSVGQLSDSDNSSRRRDAARLRPYRPHGSRELYYTEDGEDSLAESITTVESNHTVGGNSTMESTHSAQRRVTWNPSTYYLGSDDATAPSFPSQYLGSRKDVPSTSGIYGTKNPDKKDTLSTIDEKSLADDKERSGTDSGVDNPRSDLASSHGSNLSSYRRDMGNREDFTSSRVPGQYEERLTLSTRSDPGDQYATPKRSTRHHEHSDPRSDSRVYKDTFEREQYEPKPTKSRSETDLATLPDVDHKYSSPMYGDRFMELSSQPSPIYSHHTSMASPAVLANVANRGRIVDEKLMEDILNVKPLEKGPNFITRQEETSYDRMAEFSQRELGDGINKDDKPGSTPYNKAYDRPGDDSFPMRTIAWRDTQHDRSEPRSSGLEPGSREPIRSLESGNPEMELSREPVVPSDRGQDYRPRASSSESSLREVVRPLDRGSDFTSDRQPSEENVRPLDPGPAHPAGLDPGPHLDTINPGYRQTDRVIDYVRDERLLNRGPDTEPPKERRTLEKGQNYYDMYRPRKEPPTRTGMTHHQVLIDDDTEELEFRELPRCPDQDFEEMVKEEKAKIQIEYELQRRLKQKGYLQNSTDEKEFGAEYDHVPPNERAKSLQRKLEQESHRELPPNINDLWLKFQEMNQNESTSTINSSRMEAITDLLKNPTKHIVQKITDERTYEKAKERRIMQELGEKSRQEQRKDSRSERKRQELQNLRRLSEEESNGSYADILHEQQKKKLHGKHKKESRNPDSSFEGKQKKEMENQKKGSKKAKVDIPVHGDSIDTLYSIAEDASFEATPSKAEDSNQGKSKKSRQRHVIDPLMNKLKDKIESQRIKIDKERRKEIKRLDKLKKLEMLLTAKKKGKLSDQAIDVELNYVSTTSAAASSESSTLFGSETTMSAESIDNNKDSFDSVAYNGDTTSTKDSSIEIQKVRTKKVKHGGMLDAYMASIGQGGKADESEASTEDLQVVRKVRSSKPGKSDKKKTKDQQNQMKTDYVDKETLRRERSKSPKSRRLKDASTNVPSPIIKSPVSKRKVRDVYVRSEAVQTSPCRSWSPPREDQGVISVASMSSSFKRSVKTFDSKQQRQRSYSPIDSFSSTSPDRTLTNRSISPPQRQKKAAPGRKTKRSKSPPKPRICLPESDEETKQMKVSPPPKSRMFTPETPDDDLAGKLQDSPNDKKQRLKRKGFRTGGLTWFVPMGQAKPWRQPLKERQAFAVSQEPWQPKSVSSTAWKDIVADNPVNKSIGESSKFDLDTTGHYKELDEERSDEENFDPKPLARLTLQEAFETYKQDAISKLRARQKRVALASKERTLQDMLEKERNRLFAEEKRRKEANPEAHPLSENLHKPKRRAISKGEMIEQTQKLYKKLPEVQNQKLQEKRMEDYSLNRLRAKVFNRRIQRDTLKKCENRGKRSPSKNIH